METSFSRSSINIIDKNIWYAQQLYSWLPCRMSDMMATAETKLLQYVVLMMECCVVNHLQSMHHHLITMTTLIMHRHSNAVA